MMRNASAVTVGSRALLQYAGQYSSHVHLIPSSINLKYYRPLKGTGRPDRPVCLGWIGNGKHYAQDLIAVLREPLIEVARKRAIRFKVVGACGEPDLYEAFRGIQGMEIDFVDQIDWTDPAAVTQSLQDIDIGLYPLLPNDFNRYKCGFKALEYMAMEVPVVSSSMAENRDIIEDGVDGFLVTTKTEWMSALTRLIDDPDMRARMGKAGREKVEKSYTISRAAASMRSLMAPGPGAL
jgi:glycosyltransferase involved in cell wall biosynthesis